MLRGYVVNGSPCVMAGGRLHRMPATPQTVREWAQQVDVCEECGGTVCDCVTPDAMAALLARLDVDPHGENDLDGIGIPY